MVSTKRLLAFYFFRIFPDLSGLSFLQSLMKKLWRFTLLLRFIIFGEHDISRHSFRKRSYKLQEKNCLQTLQKGECVLFIRFNKNLPFKTQLQNPVFFNFTFIIRFWNWVHFLLFAMKVWMDCFEVRVCENSTS